MHHSPFTPRSSLILLFLGLVLCSCGSKQLHLEYIHDISTIAKSESFYGFLRTDTLNKNLYRGANWFVRIDGDSAIHALKQLDTSLRIWNRCIISDSTILFSSFSDQAVKIYNIYSKEQKVLLQGHLMHIASNNHKFYIMERLLPRIGEMACYELIGNELIERGRTSSHNSKRYYTFGDSGFCYESGRWVEGKGRFDSVVVVGRNLKPIYTILKDSVPEEAYKGRSPMPKYKSSWRRLSSWDNYYFSSNYINLDSKHFLIQGKTEDEYEIEYIRRKKDEEEHRENGEYLEYGPQEGYWMIVDLDKNTIKKIGYDENNAYLSGTDKTILFVDNTGEKYSMKSISVEELLK